MGCCSSNTAEDINKIRGPNIVGSSGEKSSPRQRRRVEDKNLVQTEIVDTFKPFLFNRQNNKFLEKYEIIQKIIEDTEGFRPEFLVLRESTTIEGFNENLERLMEEFEEILSVVDVKREELCEVSKFMMCENHILQKRLINYQLWNIAEVVINTYKEYVASNRKRFNRKSDETKHLEQIFKQNKDICPYKQNGPVYEPKNFQKGLPFDYTDVNRNLSYNIKFNEMRVVNFVLEATYSLYVFITTSAMFHSW